jgi:chromosome segregation ATPase
MKVSTILLAAIFTGLVGQIGPLTSIDEVHRAGPGIDYGKRSHRSKADSEALKTLQNREAEIKERIRDVESAIRKISSSERYLEGRLNHLERQIHIAGRGSGNKMLASMEVSAADFERELDVLEEEKVVFLGYLERLNGELASVKVKIDLFDLARSRVAVEDLLGKEAHSPVEDLQRMIPERYASR